jgi:chemotaxis family two-component system response regulator Rcp1
MGRFSELPAAQMPIEVLLVEDNPGDVRLTREAFRAADSHIHVNVAADGVEAMAFLRREGLHVRAPRPALILLDLNLPRMSGRELLACIKQDQDLRAIPTVVLSSSDADVDLHMANVLQASCYITKPTRSDDLDMIIGRINDFWLRNLRAPPAAGDVH